MVHIQLPSGGGGGGSVTDAAMAGALGTATAAAMAVRAELKAAFVAVIQPSGDTTGATDRAAINAVLAAGGRAVLAGVGFVIDQPLTLTSKSSIVGQSPFGPTVIQLAAGANCHVVQSQNFATLTGTDTIATPYNFALVNVTLDGNKAAQSAGAWHGVALYGYGYRAEGVTVRNCRGVALWTEWGQQSTSPGNDSMEAFITNFKFHDCDGVQGVATHGGTTSGAGIVMLGPHDSQFLNGIVYNCGTDSGAVHNGMAAIDVPAPNFGNGATFDNIHVWGGTYDYGIRIAGSGISLGALIQVEGARIAQLLVDGGTTLRANGKLFSGGVSTATTKGIVVRGGGAAVSGFVKVENCGGGGHRLDRRGRRPRPQGPRHAHHSGAPLAGDDRLATVEHLPGVGRLRHHWGAHRRHPVHLRRHRSLRRPRVRDAVPARPTQLR